MKKLIGLLVLGLSFQFAAFGHSNKELAEVMKGMGENFKVVIAGLRSGELTDQTLAAAQGLSEGIARSAELVPTTAKSEADIERYLNILEEMAVKAAELEAAIEAGNIAMAGQVLGQMNELRQIGHEQFRPPEDEH